MWYNIDGCGSDVPIIGVVLLMNAPCSIPIVEGKRGLSTAC
jgi:hypothetical protein